MKKLVKLLHELGAIGLIGALGTCLLLAWTAPAHAPSEYASYRQAIAAICKWLLVPSLGLALTSGLLAMVVHRPFLDLRWVWLKAVLGLSMFEGTLTSVAANARRGAELSARALAEGGDPAAMADLLRHERAGLWTMLALALANVALAIWRPRLRRQDPAPPPPPQANV
jgi:hypothetical protein